MQCSRLVSSLSHTSEPGMSSTLKMNDDMAKCMPVTQRCKDELLCTRPEGLVGGCEALQRRRSGREDLSSDEHGAPRYRYMSQGIQAWCQVCCCRGVIGPEDMASPDSADEQAG